MYLWLKELQHHVFVVEKGKGHGNNGRNYIYLFSKYLHLFLGHRPLVFVLDSVDVN